MVHESLITILVLLLVFVKVGAKVPAIIVFGDSTVDAGNNNQIPTIFKGNFKPYGRDFESGKPTGRFTNGRLTTDFISEAFGIKPFIPAYLDPMYNIKDFATGVTFGSAGTGYDNVTANIASVIPLWKELEYFKDYEYKLTRFMGKKKAKMILSEAVYITSLGTNDFIENYFVVPGRSSHLTIEEYLNFLAGIAENLVMELYELGARKIVLCGLPPIGCLPLLRTSNFISGGACREDFNTLARNFDAKLRNLVAKLSKDVKGIKLVFNSLLDQALHVIEKANLYGFEDVAIACCGTGTFEVSFLCQQSNPFTCKDASKYVFWDSVHPTEKLYHIVANIMMKTTLAEFV